MTISIARESLIEPQVIGIIATQTPVQKKNETLSNNSMIILISHHVYIFEELANAQSTSTYKAHVKKQNAHGNFNNYIHKFQNFSLRNTQKTLYIYIY